MYWHGKPKVAPTTAQFPWKFARKQVTSWRYSDQASHDHHCNKFPWRPIETKTASGCSKEFNACERVMSKAKSRAMTMTQEQLQLLQKNSSTVCGFSLCTLGVWGSTPSRLKQNAAQTQHISICHGTWGDSTNSGCKFHIHASTKN